MNLTYDTLCVFVSNSAYQRGAGLACLKNIYVRPVLKANLH